MAVVTTGFFDGVHLGHRAVIEALLDTAAERGEQSLIITFAPHPRLVLGKDAGDLRLLCSQQEKLDLLYSLGVDKVELIPFTKEFAALSAAQYIQMLRERYGATAMVLGYDNRLGSDLQGCSQLQSLIPTIPVGALELTSSLAVAVPALSAAVTSAANSAAAGSVVLSSAAAGTSAADSAAAGTSAANSPAAGSEVLSSAAVGSAVLTSAAAVPSAANSPAAGSEVLSSAAVGTSAVNSAAGSAVFSSAAVGSVVISSTVIRTALQRADIETANAYLGRRYSIVGTIIHGNGLGRTIGYPTANLQLDEPLKQLPAAGVYATYAILDGKRYQSMTNIDARAKIETHILNFTGDIYGKTLKVEFEHMVRPEMHFDSLQLLKLQIEKDRQSLILPF